MKEMFKTEMLKGMENLLIAKEIIIKAIFKMENSKVLVPITWLLELKLRAYGIKEF